MSGEVQSTYTSPTRLHYILKMAKKATRGRRGIASRQCRATPYPMLNCNQGTWNETNEKNCSNLMHKKDWVDSTCSVCMEYPHNAVLLLCSSHDKGCRPYMCGTSCRYSNCLDQYKKAYTKVITPNHAPSLTEDEPALVPLSSWELEKNGEVTELSCPLCRGQVKGWTVVEPARAYLNGKKRACMEDKCSFVGTYKELRRHVRSEHPSARPREVDPALEQKWRRLEREREREDVISTVMSSMPGSVVFGDYVIERTPFGFGVDNDDEEVMDMDDSERNNGNFGIGVDSSLFNMFFLFHAFGSGGNVGSFGGRRRRDDGGDGDNDGDNDGGGDGMSFVNRLRRQRRLVLGRSGRRQQRREENGEQD